MPFPWGLLVVVGQSWWLMESLSSGRRQTPFPGTAAARTLGLHTTNSMLVLFLAEPTRELGKATYESKSQNGCDRGLTDGSPDTLRKASSYTHGGSEAVLLQRAGGPRT